MNVEKTSKSGLGESVQIKHTLLMWHEVCSDSEKRKMLSPWVLSLKVKKSTINLKTFSRGLISLQSHLTENSSNHF